MKLTKISNLFLLGAVLALAAAGCKSKPQGVTYLPDGPNGNPSGGTNGFRDDLITTKAPTNNPSGPGRFGPGGNGTDLGNGGKLGGSDPGLTKPIESTPVLPPPVIPETVKPTPPTPPPDIKLGENGIPPNPLGSHDNWTQNPTILESQTVYFDFDKSSIRSSEQGKLQAVSDYLRSNPTVAVLITGNCDERGTEEYNRSLGERRALAAREYLIKLGLEAARLDTVTYGEDRPADPAHNEAAWARNRRAEFIILTAPGAK